MKKHLFLILSFIIVLTKWLPSYAAPARLTGSCGLIMNISKWGTPIRFGQVDHSSNNFLLLVNFDTGTISGYGTDVVFGANANEDPTYFTGAGNFTFTQSQDVVSGFYKLIPTNLDQMPEWKILPVNGANTYLFILSGNKRAGAGGTGVCQKL